MRVWTAHEKPHARPLLVREGFSWGAALFGPVWLAARRAWVPAALVLLAYVLILALNRAPVSTILVAGMAVLMGLSGHDLVRWWMGRTGYQQTGVVMGRSHEDARARWLTARPDLARQAMAVEMSP